MAKKLLLAEDSLTIQKVFALTFERSDIALTTVDNGEDAVRLAGEISPDLVVADVTLGDKDGFEVANALRGAEATRSCPILILAGSLPPFDEEKFRQCGADGVLFKPFESQELIDKVEGLLRGGDVPVDAAGEEAPAGSREAWDFSDVLDEVEDEAGKPAWPAQTAAALLPEDHGSAFRGEEVRSLGEFDVSLEEIERDAEGAEPSPVVDAPGSDESGVPEGGAEEFPGRGAETVEEELPVLDLQAEDLGFPEPDEEEGEFVPPEEPRAPAEVPAQEDTANRVEEPPEESVPAEEAPLERLPEGVLEPAPFVPPDPSVAELTAVPERPLVSNDPGIREEFSNRAREILEKVAAETVEQVMWEMMERLSGEIRQQIREAVESVAWDVIPATAESLIREEIERIRGKAGE